MVLWAHGTLVAPEDVEAGMHGYEEFEEPQEAKDGMHSTLDYLCCPINAEMRTCYHCNWSRHIKALCPVLVSSQNDYFKQNQSSMVGVVGKNWQGLQYPHQNTWFNPHFSKLPTHLHGKSTYRNLQVVRSVNYVDEKNQLMYEAEADLPEDGVEAEGMGEGVNYLVNSDLLGHGGQEAIELNPVFCFRDSSHAKVQIPDIFIFFILHNHFIGECCKPAA